MIEKWLFGNMLIRTKDVSLAGAAWRSCVPDPTMLQGFQMWTYDIYLRLVKR